MTTPLDTNFFFPRLLSSLDSNYDSQAIKRSIEANAQYLRDLRAQSIMEASMVLNFLKKSHLIFRVKVSYGREFSSLLLRRCAPSLEASVKRPS
jgi:hypothetical protein